MGFQHVALGPLQAAAWAEAIVCFWRHCLERDILDPRRALPIVDMTPRPHSAPALVLREVARMAESMLRFTPRLHCVAAGRRCPTDVARLLRSCLPSGQDASGSGVERNPLVVLANGTWRRLPQRLLAVHYGTLLEGDVDRLATGIGDTSSLWQPVAADTLGGAHLRAALHGHLKGLNSSPLVLSEGLTPAIAAFAESFHNGFLVLSQDVGHATEKQMRLCRFQDILAGYRRDRTLPMNIQLLAAQCRDGGALTWQSDLGNGQALLIAVGGMQAPRPALAAATVPLRDTRFADAQGLARSAAIVTARGGDTDATLALLRRSRHDPAVFLAACPALHRKLSTEHNREPWVDALAAIWRNRVCTPSTTRLYREIALACVQVAHWGLARRALSFGIGRHGESAEDLTLLAWCEANTGALDQVRSLIGRAVAKDSAHAGAKDLLRRLQRPLVGAAAASPWRQCVRHPKRPLLLEPLHVHHARALHHQYRDPQIAMMTGLPILPTVARAQQWIETRLEHGGYADFAVMGRDAGFVGHVGLRVAPPAAGFFFWIGADHQGKGYGTAAGRLLCSRALSLGLQWVFASAYRDNLRSIGALERIGFQRLAGARSIEHQDRVFLAYPRRAPSQAIGPLLAYQERELLLFEQSEHAPPLIDA